MNIQVDIASGLGRFNILSVYLLHSCSCIYIDTRTHTLEIFFSVQIQTVLYAVQITVIYGIVINLFGLITLKYRSDPAPQHRPNVDKVLSCFGPSNRAHPTECI